MSGGHGRGEYPSEEEEAGKGREERLEEQEKPSAGGGLGWARKWHEPPDPMLEADYARRIR